MKAFARVGGWFVALDMPDPRTNWRRMIGEILAVLAIFAVIYLLIWAALGGEENNMTHVEAIEEMKKLAGLGKTWALNYEAASYHEPQIRGYIAEKGGHALPAKTYAGAIKNVKAMIKDVGVKGDPAPEDESIKNR